MGHDDIKRVGPTHSVHHTIPPYEYGVNMRIWPFARAEILGLEGRPVMDHQMRQLVLDVMDGNPGALLIIRRLMYFTSWYLLLCHLKAQKLIGSRLWQVVKDEYDENWTQFACDQFVQIEFASECQRCRLGRPAAYYYN
jgi:hypothetical protein